MDINLELEPDTLPGNSTQLSQFVAPPESEPGWSQDVNISMEIRAGPPSSAIQPASQPFVGAASQIDFGAASQTDFGAASQINPEFMLQPWKYKTPNPNFPAGIWESLDLSQREQIYKEENPDRDKAAGGDVMHVSSQRRVSGQMRFYPLFKPANKDHPKLEEKTKTVLPVRVLLLIYLFSLTKIQ